MPDGLEAGSLVQADTALVLGEHARLNRPDAGGFGGGDQRFEQAPADALAAGALGDVDTVLDHSLVAAATGDGADGGPADDLAVPKRDEAMLGEMGRVPASQAGTSVSKVAFLVAMPSAYTRATPGQCSGRRASIVVGGELDRHQQQPARAAG